MIQLAGSAVVEHAPSGRFLRSVRLDHDLYVSGALSTYSVTPQVQELLRRFARALDSDSTDRAWTITGPYGTGKSACALFLARLADNGIADAGDAWSLLRSQAPSVAKELEESLGEEAGLFAVILTLRRASVARSLGEALLVSLDRLPDSSDRRALAAELRTDLQSSELDTRRLLDRLRRAGGFFRALPGCLDYPRRARKSARARGSPRGR